MDLLHKILTVACILLLIGAAFFGYQWLQEHDAKIRAEAQSKADEAANAKLVEQQKVFADQLSQIRKDTDEKIANNNKQFSQAQSPQQFAALIAQIMGLKQTPIIVNPQPTAENPHPAPVIELPDTPQAKLYFQECEECKINLANAAKTATISDANLKVEQEKLKNMTDDRDNWKNTANGGTWKKRAVKRGEAFLIDIGIAAAIYCGTGNCKKK